MRFLGFLGRFVPKNWLAILVWILGFGLAGYICSLNGCGQFPFPFPNPPVPVWLHQTFDAGDGTYQFGWRNDPDAVKAIAAKLPFRTFADTPAGQVQDPLPDQVFLWEIYKKADPRGPPIKNQGQVGSCVSFGTHNAILRTMVCYIALQQIAKNLPPDQIKDVAEEVTYAGGRIQIGEQVHHAHFRGSDGCVGAYAAEFVHTYGLVAREKTEDGQFDLSTYNEARCRQWGNSGVPAPLVPTTRIHPVQEITQIRSTDDAKKALASGYGIAVCSNQGFSMQRDANGVAAPRGNWSHCMCIDGYCTINGQLHFHIQNSWGAAAHTGPVGPGNPDTGGFWAAATVVSRMIAAGDTWTFSNVKGFPSQRKELDWIVRNQQRPLAPEAFALAGTRIAPRIGPPPLRRSSYALDHD